MNLSPLILVVLCGCASIVKEIKSPPFPLIITHHTRVVGIEANVPNQAGDSVFKIRLGFFSDTTTLLPCSTNEMHAPAFSDRFKVGESGLDTTITEEVNTGWKDQPPPPMLRKLISPKDQRQGSNHGTVFIRQQTEAVPYIQGDVVTVSRQLWESTKAAADSTAQPPPPALPK